MQLCQFLPCVALKLALVEKFGHLRVGLHGFHCRVQLAAINTSHKRTGLYFEYTNDNDTSTQKSVGSHRQWFMLFTRQHFFNYR